ncbi:arrestin domain-containing protein 3-like [Amia ocellicauda]|uniref:arrestin domain-containing protein 3-like n=1 Tax=Amia ocellicauda TaxID=2972642 RepID=UPI0034645798
MQFKSIKSFTLELEGPADAVYTSGELLSGQVVLELNREVKVRALKVLGRGVATAHWLENRSVGMNTVYNDYTSKETYFRKRQHLIRGLLVLQTSMASEKRKTEEMYVICSLCPMY